jgi:hypothetical protein
MGNNIAVLTEGNIAEIEEWLKERNIKYHRHSGMHFCNWLIADDHNRLLFMLRWGMEFNKETK